MLTTRCESNENNKMRNRRVDELMRKLQCVKCSDVAREILEDSTLKVYQKVAILVSFIESIFSEMRKVTTAEEAKKFLRLHEWDAVGETLDVLEEYLGTVTWRPEYDHYYLEEDVFDFARIERNYSCWYNGLFLAIAQSSDGNFEYYMQEGMELMSKNKKSLSEMRTYSNEVMSFEVVNRVCKCFDQCFLLVPYLIKAEIEAEVTRYSDDNKIGNYVDAHESILECADMVHEQEKLFVLRDYDDIIFDKLEAIKWIDNRYELLKTEVERAGGDIYCFDCSISEMLMKIYKDNYHKTNGSLESFKAIIDSAVILSEKERLINSLIYRNFSSCEYYLVDDIYNKDTDWVKVAAILSMEEKMLNRTEKREPWQINPYEMKMFRDRNNRRRAFVSSKLTIR